jgi:hypothetical protein
MDLGNFCCISIGEEAIHSHFPCSQPTQNSHQRRQRKAGDGGQSGKKMRQNGGGGCWAEADNLPKWAPQGRWKLNILLASPAPNPCPRLPASIPRLPVGGGLPGFPVRPSMPHGFLTLMAPPNSLAAAAEAKIWGGGLRSRPRLMLLCPPAAPLALPLAIQSSPGAAVLSSQRPRGRPTANRPAAIHISHPHK